MFKTFVNPVLNALNHAAPGLYKDNRLGLLLNALGKRTNVVPAVVAGGAAGNFTVTGISVGDEIVSVIHHNGTTVQNLTGEFSVSAADTINNTGGTATAGTLVIQYRDLT